MMNYRSKDVKQQERIEKTLVSIGNECDKDYLHRQLAEECVELAHAALKMIRVYNDETPADGDLGMYLALRLRRSTTTN